MRGCGKTVCETQTEHFKMHLGDILQSSDDLSHAINSYEKIVDGRMIGGEMERAQQKQAPVGRGTFCF